MRTLADYRKVTSLTQQQLAAHLGVSQSAVSQWEKGDTRPDIEHIRELAKILRITGDEVLSAIAASKRDTITIIITQEEVNTNVG